MTSYTYSHWDVMLADPDNPITKAKRDYNIGCVKEAMDNLLHAEEPTMEDWKKLSDIVNFMKTLLIMGFVADEQGALKDAEDALGKCGMRSMADDKPLRLDGPAISLLHGVIEDYEMISENLPARTMIMAHRASEKRVQEEVLKELMRMREAA